MLHSTALRYFQAVTQEKSIRAASEKLHIDPTAISRQIRNLENDLNVKLFDRCADGMALTPAGRILHRYMDHNMLLVKDLRQELDQLVSMQSGHVSVAFVESFINSSFPARLESFHERNPAVTLEIIVDGTRSILEGIENESYDIGVMFNPASENVAIHYTCKHSLSAIMAPDHPLAKQKSVKFEQVQIYPLVVPAGKGGSRALFEAMAKSLKYSVKPALETNSPSIVAAFLQASRGVGILSSQTSKRFIDEGALVSVPLKESKLVGKYVVGSKKDRVLTPAAKIIKDIICLSMKDLEDMAA